MLNQWLVDKLAGCLTGCPVDQPQAHIEHLQLARENDQTTTREDDGWTRIIRDVTIIIAIFADAASTTPLKMYGELVCLLKRS